MKHILNKSEKYYQAKNGHLVDSILSSKEIYEVIYGLILYYMKMIKENQTFPLLDLNNLQKQINYSSILHDIKTNHFQKINSKDKKMYLAIFLSLEFTMKENSKREKI